MSRENSKESTSKRLNLTSNVQPMSLDGNLAVNWKKWLQLFNIFMKASGLSDDADDRKVAVLLHFIGEKVLDIFNTFNLNVDTVKYNTVIQKFENYFVPKTNITYESYKFFTRKQKDGESLEDFLTDLVNKSKSCDFKDLCDRIVKDIFICNLHEKYQFVREKLLLEEELTLEKAVNISKSLIQSLSQASELKGDSSNIFYTRQNTTVNDSLNNMRSRSKSRSQSMSRYLYTSRSQSRSHSQSRNVNKNCHRCGQIHRYRCPATKARCRKCKAFGHYEAFCRSKQVQYLQQSSSTNGNNSQGNKSNFFIGHLQSSYNISTDWKINFQINNYNIVCILDTGSDANVMSLNTFNLLNINNNCMSPCHAKITSFSGNNVKVLGQQSLYCTYYVKKSPVSKSINFIIVDVSAPTVIGKNTCSELGLVKRVFNIQSNESISSNVYTNNILNNVNTSNMSDCMSHVKCHNINELLNHYNFLFTGLGCLPGKCHITVDPNVPSIIDPPRKIPFALHDRVKKELDLMEQLDVIEKVTEPTLWVSSLLVVEKKNGQLRICLDPRNLNKAICRSHYPIPTIDMVRSKLHGAAYFSTLDANSGFWALCLDEESSMLCTFNTPFGRYRFKRLPYGINCAPEIFHRTITEIFDLPGAIVYADDLLIFGRTLQEHNENLQRVFKKAQEVNLRFNKTKCMFGKTQVKYLGHIFSRNQVSPDPDKVRAIKDMPSPVCLKDLQRFLGLLNYLGGFIENMATETEPLRQLLKKSSDWQWNASHEAAFIRLKDIISNAPVLTHYDTKKPVILSVDASQSAVGAVLLQDNHPICYASKTLTSCQQRMAQIEKELYAIVFGCLHFHQYIYGRVVTVETDHRPLITLFKKPLADVPTRLQRLMLRIQSYDLKVEYKPGSKMYIADSLSRAALPETSEDEIDENLVIHVNLILKNLPITEERLKWLTEAVNKDESLQLLKKYYYDGWPDIKSKVDQLVMSYWNCRHEIHVIENLLLKGNSLIIPKALRPDILKMIHSGHQGAQRSKSFARGVVYWPYMSHDIENIVKSCDTCLSNSKANPPEPMMSHEICNFPWEKVGIDYLQFKNQIILVIEDYYSNYIEIANVTNTSARVLINVLKPIFSRHGIPLIIMSDNGPPYNSKEFKAFLDEWCIQHTTSSPYVPRSNGLIESGVKVVKRILTKCAESGTDPHLALLQYRTTPRGNLPSPAELLMSRRLRTQIPIVLDHLKPKIINYEDYRKIKQEYIYKQKFYYNKNTKYLPEVKEGDSVLYKKKLESKWEKGRIVKKCQEPRSFIIETLDGTTYRRNRQHILKPCLKQSGEVEKKKFIDKEEASSEIQEKGIEGNLESSNIKRTLSGRQVKPPVRFKDYYC